MKTAGIKHLLNKVLKTGTLIPSVLIILIALIIALQYLFAYLRGDIMVEASGRANTNFNVFYLENDTFPVNPIAKNLQYLMSFTDYIEADSRFTARLSDEAEMHYHYTATVYLVIHYMANADGNMNAAVYEETHPLAEEKGSYTGSNFTLQGGSFTLYPKQYIDTYLNFIEAQARQMEAENVIAQNLRGFSAELHIDFNYSFNVPEWGINETATQGYRMSLSSEVYAVVTTGSPSFSQSVNTTDNQPRITLLKAIAFSAFVALGVFGLLRGIKKMQAHPNENYQEIITILKKYANEIIISDKPLSFNKYTLVYISIFESLLKLAVNLNKHIKCYHNDEYAEFAVIVDEYAYYYTVDYHADIHEKEMVEDILQSAEDEAKKV